MKETMTDSTSTWRLVATIIVAWMMGLLGIAIYVLSVLAAAQFDGLSVVLTIFLPPFAQAYWLLYGWAVAGVTPYTIACVAWAVLLLVSALLVATSHD